MHKIKVLVDGIDEEIEDAKCYAEEYLSFKSIGDGQFANRYKEMANDEIKHAGYIHERAIREIEQLNTVYTPPEEMQMMWNESHKMYVERVAWIKQMLSM